MNMGSAVFAFAAVIACSDVPNPKHPQKDGGQSTFRLFFMTELRGTIEPCGCTSDPLGDIARTTALIEKQRNGGKPAIVIDGGSTLFSETKPPPHLVGQETRKATLILDTLSDLGTHAFGLGPYDLAQGVNGVKPARQAANLVGHPTLVAPPKLVSIGDTTLGIFGVVAPEAVEPFGLRATDPIRAADQSVQLLRAKGAQRIVAIAHMTRSQATTLAKTVNGIDFLLIGQDAPEPTDVSATLQQVKNTWLIRPANRGQVVTQIDVTLRGPGPLADAIGEFQAGERQKHIAQQVKQLESKLGEWEKDPNGDAAFIATKRKELTQLRAESMSFRTTPLRIPTSGSWFVASQIRIRKGLPCAPKVVAAKKAFDKAAGAANVAAAKTESSKPLGPNQAGFAGIEECSYCHAKAVKFWQTTRHAGAFTTLEKLGKQFNYDCISCHVTGWQRPGGATLGNHDALKAIQCEVCHGPGSLHVDAEGTEKPKKVTRASPKRICLPCHNKEHSDTFDYEAYLRDVTGPGHGEAFRKQLGPGPTGRELRQKALDVAGRSIGAGCPK